MLSNQIPARSKRGHPQTGCQPAGVTRPFPYRIEKTNAEFYPPLCFAGDGKSVAFIELEMNSKLIMWEDPFIWE